MITHALGEFRAASGLGFDTIADIDFATFEVDGVRPYKNDLVRCMVPQISDLILC